MFTKELGVILQRENDCPLKPLQWIAEDILSIRLTHHEVNAYSDIPEGYFLFEGSCVDGPGSLHVQIRDHSHSMEAESQAEGLQDLKITRTIDPCEKLGPHLIPLRQRCAGKRVQGSAMHDAGWGAWKWSSYNI